KNRTTAEIKNIFERGGGSLAAPGAVSYQFKKMGLITVEKTSDVDNQILKLIDFGAEDVEEATDAIEVYIPPQQLKEMKKKIEDAGFSVKGAELVMQPITPLLIGDSQKAEKVLRFMETLEDHEDVQKVYANFDIPNEVLAKLESEKN
ncbi:MAG: YebC/PmpR family DNA-binding transcriptional regulator, partial [Microgenomates group bacterium]